MSSVEQQLTDLENESKALKVGFESAATQFPLFTNSKSMATTPNEITTVMNDNSVNKHNDQERVIVTFAAKTGSNTIAKLEMSTSNPALPVVRRRLYSGGAQWVVTNGPDQAPGGSWKATTYNFTVQSSVDGNITLSEAVS